MSRAALLIALVSAPLAGCVLEPEPETRLDSVTLRAGNAIHASRAIMTVDPQAHRAENVHIAGDGIAVGNAIEARRRLAGRNLGAGTAVPGGLPGVEGLERAARSVAQGAQQ